MCRAPSAGDSVDFTWTNYYSEGSNDSGAHADTNGPFTTSVELGTPVVTELKTYVPSFGGTFYTGGGVAKIGDLWTTTLNVRKAAKVEVLEESSSIPVAPDLLSLETSDVSIPDVTFDDAAPLIIWLRRDASTIAKGAKISSAKIYYTGSLPAPIPGPLYPYDVLPCTDKTYGDLPKPGIPCIKARTEFTKKTAPSPDWVSDWQFEIWAKTNGRYTN